ncbi:hypothetical protein F4802DRAFT_68132 [Xylaria palmicola]|nr:hypothetical protein F4802DRAFT_68132 [Xylaria palmicola]
MSVDLTIPATSSPTIHAYKDMANPLLPFALYVHVALSDEDELSAIEDESNSQTGGATVVKRALRHDLSERPLRAAFADHLGALSARRYDPFHFVAVVDKNWREAGVVIVAMDDGSDEDISFTDQLRLPVRDTGMVLVNLQLANVDWAACREAYTDDQEDDGHDGGGGDDEAVPVAELGDAVGAGEEDPAAAPNALADMGFWIGLYAVPEVDHETVLRALNLDWGPPLPALESTPRPEARAVGGSLAEAFAKAARAHLVRCRHNTPLHHSMFLVGAPGYHEAGILLVQMEQNQKYVPSLKPSILPIFGKINAGYRPWRRPHKTFLAYAGRGVRCPSAYLAAVDPAFKSREPGSERFLAKNAQLPPQAAGGAQAGLETVLGTVLGQHWGFVREERFRGALCPEYSVFCDRELGAGDVGAAVTLVKVERDAGWSAVECAAGDAYGTLCDLVDETQEWLGGSWIMLAS